MTRTGNTVAVASSVAEALVFLDAQAVDAEPASGTTPVCRTSARFPREMEDRND
jgi:hypothetical protein